MTTVNEQRLLAWHTFPCETCNRPVGQRCRSLVSGAWTVPHAARMRRAGDYLAGQESRQGEVDDLDTLLDEGRSEMMIITERMNMITAQRDAQINLTRQAEESRDVAQRRVGELVAEVSTLTASLNESAEKLGIAEQRWTEHMATHVPPTLFGAGGANKDRTKDGIDIDRWYGGSGDVDKGIARAKANHAAGIRTWLSFKCPHSWADMVAGKGDAWARDLFLKLDGLGFEVWVAFHHEPEGDGDTKVWTAMQDRLSRMLGLTTDVKFWLIVTGWHQEFGTDSRLKWDALFPKGAPIYGIAYDFPYLKYGFVWDKATGKKTTAFQSGWTEGTIYVEALAASAKRLGVKAGIGESAYSDEAFAKDPLWLDRVLASVVANGLAAYCYYDTMVNSVKSWTLGADDSPKRQHYRAAVEAMR